MERDLKFDLTIEPNALLCPNPQEFYSRAYLTRNIEGNFRLLPGIKYKTKVAIDEFGRVSFPSDCDWDNTKVADNNLGAMDIDVTPISGLSEICQFDAETAFFSNMIQQGSNHSNFTPQMFMTEYFNAFAAKLAEEQELTMWQGDTALAGTTFLSNADGFNKKLLASATAATADDVVGITGVPINKGNVIAEMSNVYQALKKTILHKTEDLRWYMSPNVAAAYLEAVAENNTILYTTMNPELTWLGRIKIVIQDGMADNEMVLTRYQNLIYAFDALKDDSTSLKAIDLRETVAEPKLRTRVDMKIGFFLAEKTKDEIVYYSPNVPV